MQRENIFESISVALIHTFHVPIFFLLSAITRKYSTDWKSFRKNTIKSMKRLLLPAYLIYFIAIIVSIFKEPANIYSLQFWQKYLLGALYYTGIPMQFMGIQIPSVFASWFFIALFLAMVIFDYLQMVIPKKILLAIVCVLSCIGVGLGKHEVFILSFDIALAVLPFIYIGFIWKDLKKCTIKKTHIFLIFTVCFIVWVLFSLLTYNEFLNLAWRVYPLYPLCFFAAFAASYLLMQFSKLLEKAKIFYPLQFLGKYCIYFFAIHSIDIHWPSLYNITDNCFIHFLIRTAINLVIFFVLVSIHIGIKKIKQHKKKSLANS